MSKQTVTELEVLFTADTKQVDKAAKDVESKAKKIEKKPIKAEVDADVAEALKGMGRVEDEAKKIVSAKTVATVDANIERAEKNLTRTQERLDYLRSVETHLEVSADITRAEKALERAERQRSALVSARSKIDVDADTAKAEKNLEDLADEAADSGKEAGQKAGSGLVSNLDGATRGAGEKVGQVVGGDIGSSLEDALTAIPIAGGIILAGVAIGKAIVGGIQDGMQLQVGTDRLQALTGMDPIQTRRMADAAAEAYVNSFGESMEANMSTSRLAIQYDLIDADASRRSAQEVIEGLAGIADVLEEDVQPVGQAVATMLSTGIVKSADEAFDVLATGAREGVNIAGDLLDTFIEYPALFARLGLDAPTALGLMNQGLEGGARNADLVADALKEFQIRATDATEASAEGFEAIGLNAEEMTAKIAAGGEGAKEGLGQVLEGLRNIEDPVERNIAGVALFGTQWEDMGAAMGSLDLSTAVDELNGVTDAAQTMFDILADNDATKMVEAQRNLEVAADGMKGALAAAFSEPLGDFADWVSSNRGPLLQFFSDLVNSAIDFAQAANTGIGDFVAGPLAGLIDGLASLMKWKNPFADVSELRDLADDMRGFKDTTAEANETLETMRGEFNSFADNQISLGYVHDAAKRTAIALDEVGTASDGSTLSLAGFDEANLSAAIAGTQLDEQIRSAVDALNEEITVAAAAGEGQSDLAGRYAEATGALTDQLVSMGLTEDQAKDLVDTYMKVPGAKATAVSAPGAVQSKGYVDNLLDSIDHMPAEKQTEIRALVDAGDIAAAERQLDYVARARRAAIYVGVSGGSGVSPAMARSVIDNARGNILEFANGGFYPGLTPMQPVAQMVPPNTWRVVGDRSDVDELYAPLDGSTRSWSLILEGIRRMGGMPMGAGGVTGDTVAAPAAGDTYNYDVRVEGLSGATWFERNVGSTTARLLRQKRRGR